MRVELLVKKIKELGINTITGIPDSTLKVFCDYLNAGQDFEQHFVPANEGAAIGIAIGEYLATGMPACVYMQNSGLGNIVNPVTSLANEKVYGIPMLFIIGWRGEPDTSDEPQHKFMGLITEEILHVLQIPYEIIENNTTEEQLAYIFDLANATIKENKQFAIVVKRGTFDSEKFSVYKNENSLSRERAIEKMITWLEKEDLVVATTGKISREFYEQSNEKIGNHKQAFLTVGGMGHASMIAYQLAKRNPKKRVICLDGDGAVLMHMGSLAIIGKNRVDNMIHVCLNNDAHESVGGMPTGAAGISYSKIAKACGYEKIYEVSNEDKLEEALMQIRKKSKLTFLEVKVAIGSRDDLGRPKESAKKNMIEFMENNEVL